MARHRSFARRSFVPVQILQNLARRAKPIMLLALVLALSGCVALFVSDDDVPEAERKQIDAETAPYRHVGSGSISGVVRLDTAYGVFFGSLDTVVALTPATTIASARFQEYVVEKDEIPEQRKAELILFTHTDSAGQFHFGKLPPGNYLLASPVLWSPTGNTEDAHFEVPYARVTLGPGEAASVVVTRSVNSPPGPVGPSEKAETPS
jgi:hypothetical protein